MHSCLVVLLEASQDLVQVLHCGVCVNTTDPHKTLQCVLAAVRDQIRVGVVFSSEVQFQQVLVGDIRQNASFFQNHLEDFVGYPGFCKLNYFPCGVCRLLDTDKSLAHVEGTEFCTDGVVG